MDDKRRDKPEIPVHEWPGARHVDDRSYGGDMIFLDKPAPAPKSRQQILPEEDAYRY